MLNSNIQKKTVTVTWENGKTPTNESVVSIAGIVIFSIYYSGLSFTQQWVQIGSVPSAYIPASPLYIGSGLGGGKYLYISNTGVIMVKADSEATNVVAAFNIAYAV